MTLEDIGSIRRRASHVRGAACDSNRASNLNGPATISTSDMALPL
jgi:hypothetical protein